MFFSAFVTPATPRTPAGGRACGTPRLIGGLLFRPRLSADTLGFAQFPPLTSVNFAGSRYKKFPCAGASGAERTARGKKGADHRPSARRWPGYVRRGTGGASNCTNGLNYGPWTAKSPNGPRAPRAVCRATCRRSWSARPARDVGCPCTSISRLCSPRHAGGCYERHEGTTSAGNHGGGSSRAQWWLMT